MTIAEFKKEKTVKQSETQIQQSCVSWFRRQYPQLQNLLFAVPNGEKRDVVHASRMKAEGMVSGVSDLILLRPNDPFHGLLIEMKTPTGKQSAEQQQFMEQAQAWNYKYVICRSIEEFMKEVNNYLKRL